MKTEYVALTPLGFAAAIIAGVLLGTVVHTADLGHAVVVVAISGLLFLHVRNDAIQPIPNGTYRRRFFIWRQDGEPEQTISPAIDERRALH